MKLFPLIFFLSLFFFACSREAPIPELPQPVGTYFPLSVGTQEIQVQVALTHSERQRGLMYRESLPEDSGMLFVFETPRNLSFWMKDTRIPLDIAYIEPSGRIAEIYPLYPFNTDSVPSVSRNLSMALEMDQGWFAKNGLKPGAMLDLGQIVGMIEARGFSPEQFALLTD